MYIYVYIYIYIYYIYCIVLYSFDGVFGRVLSFHTSKFIEVSYNSI